MLLQDSDPRLPTTIRRVAGSVRRRARQAKWALEDRRLIAEQDRRVLGRAHRRWRGNSAAENQAKWTSWNQLA